MDEHLTKVTNCERSGGVARAAEPTVSRDVSPFLQAKLPLAVSILSPSIFPDSPDVRSCK